MGPMARDIVILTGAGISAESGLGTFREEGGLWTQYDLEQVATPEGFAADPRLVHDFYNARRANCRDAVPNTAHKALADLEDRASARVLIVTQNVDDLHERAGSRAVWHMHGELARALCGACGHRWPAPAEMAPADPCPACRAPATRPDVVWFGEYPYGMEAIHDRLDRADLFVAIGTSGNVYPAAGFAAAARAAGAWTLELNLEPSLTARDFAETRQGKATELVPAWVAEILGG